MFFKLYTGALNSFSTNCGINIHTYADDINIYIGFSPTSYFAVASHDIHRCLKAIEEFMFQYFLKLNVNKTQLLVCGQRNTLEIFAPPSEKLEKASNLKQC